MTNRAIIFTEPTKAGDALRSALTRLAALEAQWKDRRAEMLLAAPGAPQQPCPQSGADHKLNHDRTLQASGLTGPWRWEWEDCAACEAAMPLPWMTSAGVPKRLLMASFGNWTVRTPRDATILNACREFAGRPGGFLVLHGGVGLGKTHLAVSIMRACRRGIMLTQNSFLVRLRATYRSDYAVNPVERCKDARLLVMDELGLSTGGRDEIPALYEVLNHRHGEDKKTVITTNLAPDHFEEAFGERIADRLADYLPFLEFKGRSWRGSK